MLIHLKTKILRNFDKDFYFQFGTNYVNSNRSLVIGTGSRGDMFTFLCSFYLHLLLSRFFLHAVAMCFCTSNAFFLKAQQYWIRTLFTSTNFRCYNIIDKSVYDAAWYLMFDNTQCDIVLNLKWKKSRCQCSNGNTCICIFICNTLSSNKKKE